jgi:hypothetical protein
MPFVDMASQHGADPAAADCISMDKEISSDTSKPLGPYTRW